MIELLKIYENMVLTSFLDLFQPSSMRISLILHLNFVHIKPQQPNRFDSCTDTGKYLKLVPLWLFFLEKPFRFGLFEFPQNIIKFWLKTPIIA